MKLANLLHVAGLGVLLLTGGAQAQPMMGGGMGGMPPGAAGLPPFLAKMKRHDVDVHVVVLHGQTDRGPAGAGLPVTITISAGGAKVRTYDAQTDAGGIAHFQGVPSNPEVQAEIGYTVSVDSQGVRFPFNADNLPVDGGYIEVAVGEVTSEATDITLEHSHIDIFPDEENIVFRHAMQLFNNGTKVVNLANLPGGGLRLPLPAGGKHPEMHEDTPTELAEVRGTDIWYKGALLPGGNGTEVTAIYTVDYSDDVYEFVQALPVRTTGALVVVPTGKQEGQRVDLPLKLLARGDQGTVRSSEGDGGRRFDVLRAPDLQLAPGQTFRFAIAGLPTPNTMRQVGMAGALLGVVGLVFFGFRSTGKGEATRLSRAHLEAERDRLQKALDRMRKAVDKGRLSQARFEREQEAITARLVTLYRTLDRLESK